MSKMDSPSSFFATLISNIDELTAASIEASKTLRDYSSSLSKGAAIDESRCDSRLLERLRTITNELSSAIKEVSSLVDTVQIPWTGNELNKLNMMYCSGLDPWDFYLCCSNRQDRLDAMNHVLMERLQQNTLKKFETVPKEGDIILIRERNKFYRALVLNCNGKNSKRSLVLVRFVKIDLGEEGVTMCDYKCQDEIFTMPRDIADVPCQMMNCCLNIEDKNLKNLWSPFLGMTFKKILSESILTVDILPSSGKTVKPIPQFLVRMYGYNEELQQEVNFSSWVNAKILFTLKKMGVVDAEEDVILSYLDEECLNPFRSLPKVVDNQGFGDSNSKGAACIKKENAPACDNERSIIENGHNLPYTHNIDEPDPVSIGLSVQKVSKWMEMYTDEVSIKSSRRAAAIHPVELKEPSFSKSKEVIQSEMNNSAHSNSGKSLPLRTSFNPKIDKKSSPSQKSNISATQVSPHNHSVASSSKLKDNASLNSKMSPSAVEFVPSCHVEIIPGTNEEVYDGVISNLEEEYQPKDEQRICWFHQTRGFCNRIGCTKEHVKPNNNWTNDKIEVNIRAFNNIDLPKEQSKTVIKGQHVINGISFYSTLHDLYSDLNEHGPPETLESLYEHINSIQNSATHPLLIADPSITEAVLALGIQRSLGPKKKWLRAMVTEVLDNVTVEVFFVDFGNKEIVHTKDLRKIRPQFLHLPYQAVLTTLTSIQMVKGKEKDAKTRLQKLVKGNLLKATIESRNIGEAELDVFLFTEDDVCINNLMVDEGLCQAY